MKKMFDLHTHTIHSDGEMLPIELIRRMAVLGYTTVAIADHVDTSNVTTILGSLALVKDSAQLFGVNLLCGVEITHVPPEQIAGLAKQAKDAGGDIVIVHGETPVEPVAPGTNRAACTCRYVDVLAHPGMINIEDAIHAAKNNIALEVTSRSGHNRTNGYVVQVARETGCQVVVDSDAHGPHDLLDERARFLVAKGAGLTEAECRDVLSLNIEQFLSS
ncbi:MAG: histidinol phosphate phosphatase domain-containing protein [Methanoregula sp.]|nr:MAG: histidinol phosphate phosphatase domain-containing protein [Methanoregula sp.]